MVIDCSEAADVRAFAGRAGGAVVQGTGREISVVLGESRAFPTVVGRGSHESERKKERAGGRGAGENATGKGAEGTCTCFFAQEGGEEVVMI